MMTPLRRAITTAPTVLEELRQVRVTVSTPEVGRDGHVLVTSGIDLSHYLQNPVVLFSHDPLQPIARAANLASDGEDLVALVQFPPDGVSGKADEVYGLIRAGVLNAVSIGIDPLNEEPIDPSRPDRGMLITAAELLEFSFVSIPAVRGALVTERAAMTGAAKDRKMPITAEHSRIARSLVARGLYDVGRLAGLLDELGWAKNSAEWEAAIEEDGSLVPAMLGEALKKVGEALLAMAAEEVAELLGPENGIEVETPADLVAEDAEYIEMAKTVSLRRLRAGIVAGRSIGRVAPKKPEPQPLSADRFRRKHQRMARILSPV